MPYTHYYFDDHSNSNIMQSNAELLYCGFVRNMENWRSENQRHDYCEVLYVCDGYASVFIDDFEYDVHPGDIVVYNRGAVHHEEAGEGEQFSFLFVSFKNLITEELPVDHLVLPDFCPVFSTGENKYKLGSLFKDLINESKDHVDWYEVVCDNILTSIIVSILRMQNAIKPSSEISNSKCKIIKDYIDNNYSDNITLDVLSDLVYVSKHHLVHMFKKEFGISPICYHIMRRMEEAKIMLRDTDISIHEIADKLGYDNTSYFSQIFKKHIDVSPLYYRKQHLFDMEKQSYSR